MTDKTVAVRLLAHIGQYQAQMARAAASTRMVSADMSAMARTSLGASGGIKELGQQTGLLNPKLLGPVGIVVGLTKAAKASIAWESAFAGVRKTVDATDRELADLEGGLRRLAKTIPVGTTELAGIAEAAGQLGIQTGNILEFTDTIAKLSATTNLGAQEGATALARFANITQMAEEDFDRLASTVVDLGNNLATTEAEIVEMALRLAGAGAQVGMTEADILSLAGAMSSVGIQAEAGGTAMSRVMVDIASAVANGSDKVAEFAQIAGMSSSEFSRAFRDDAAGAIVAFVQGLTRISDAGGNVFAVLEQLGMDDIRIRDTLLRLAGDSEGLTDALDLGTQAWEENTAAQEEFAKRADTTAAKFDVLKNKVGDIGISIGQLLGPGVDLALGILNAGADAVSEILQPGSTTGTALAYNDDPAFGGRRFLNPADFQQQIDAGTMQLHNIQGTNVLRVVDPNETRANEAATARLQGLADQYNEVGAAASGAVGGVEEFAGAQGEMSAFIEDANGNLMHQVELFRDQYADPVFQLVDAVDELTAAQQAYDDAVAKNDAEGAEQAARRLFDALGDVQIATDMAAGKFDAVNNRLDEMRQDGFLTAEQVLILKRIIAEARVESEKWTKTYGPTFDVEDGELRALIDRLREAGRLITAISGSHGIVVNTTGRGPGGITEFHRGGRITQSTPGWLPGMRPDERLIKAQVGETVVPAGGQVVSAGGDDGQVRQLLQQLVGLVGRDRIAVDMAVTTDTRRAGENVYRRLRDLEEVAP